MNSGNIERLLTYVDEKYPKFNKGIKESIAKTPERFEYITDLFLSWVLKAWGNRAMERSVDASVQFTTVCRPSG